MTTSTIRRMQAEANAARQGLKRSLERSSSMPAKQSAASTEEIGSELHIAQREPNFDHEYPNCYVDVKTGEPFSGPPEGYIIAEGTASSPDEVDAVAIANADAEGDELAEVLDRQAIPWIPQVAGDQIYGKVLALYEVESVNERNPMAPALELQTKSGAVFEYRAYSETAQSQLERHNPQVGDWLGIKYLGRVESKVKNHKPYHNVRMAVKRGGAA